MPEGLSAETSLHLDVGYQCWWDPCLNDFSAKRSPYLNVSY